MYKLIAIACLLLTLSGVHANPLVNTETVYYQVDGNNAPTIRQDMNRKRAGQYDAYTQWWVKWRFYWKNQPDSCVLTKAITDVKVKFTLPKLAENSHADADAQQRWQRYYRALIAHENGHRDFGVNAAAAIEKALLAMGSREDCATLEKEANNLGHTIVNQYIADEKQYDIDTNHGMNNGAVFP